MLIQSKYSILLTKYMAKEERPIQLDSAITETTHQHLIQSLTKLEARRGELGIGTDYTSGLHDDPAVVRDIQQLDGNIDKIRSILKNCNVLDQRSDTTQIGVGNKIKIKFEEENEEELYRLGTRIDASYSSEDLPWMSVESPLGKELNGKKKGDTVKFKLGQQEKQVKVLDVLGEK